VAKPETLWLLGCGNMAGAMLSRWLDTGMDPASVTVIDPALPQFDGVRALSTLPDEPAPAMLLLGVKPQMLRDVAQRLSEALGPETILLSILAGTTYDSLAARFPQAKAIVRVMPNLPVRIGKGAVALHAPGVARAPLDTLFAPLSGSGPAFVYRFAEALAKGGAAMGLDAAQADRLARATVEGAALLAAASAEPLGALADRVASKGGSTRVGLDVLDADAALARLVEAALRASQARNRELGG
jgi:pyrroline-5-carboxylate reductase